MIKYFIINCIISVLFLLYFRMRNYSDRYVRFIIMLLLPFVGLILFLTLDIYAYVFKPRNVELTSEDENKTDKVSLFMRKGVLDKELNMVSIEEALILNDNSVKRNLMINILKSDAYMYLGLLKKALKDKDTETSHYAATAVSEIKRKLTLAIQEFQARKEKEKDNIFFLEAYSDVIRKYIESGLLDNKSLEKYSYLYSDILTDILKTDLAIEFYYEEKIKIDITLKKFDEAAEICREYMKVYKNSEKPFILLMNIYFIKKDKESFNEILSDLRNSNIKLQWESLAIVRYWLEG